MSSLKRLRKELSAMKRNPLPNISVRPVYGNLHQLQACIRGPEECPYEGGYFNLRLTITDTYPFTPPRVKFNTRVFHPNIATSGMVCLNILEEHRWSAVMTIEKLLLSLSSLLSEPNFDDPINVLCMDGNDVEYFNEKAKEWTQRHASKDEYEMFGDTEVIRNKIEDVKKEEAVNEKIQNETAEGKREDVVNQDDQNTTTDAIREVTVNQERQNVTTNESNEECVNPDSQIETAEERKL